MVSASVDLADCASPAGDWELCGDRFYSRSELYSMPWAGAVQLANMRVAAAPLGGPIAVTRAEGRLVALTGPAETSPVIKFFSASGTMRGAAVWQGGGGGGRGISSMGWSDAQQLMVMDDRGEVVVYSAFGEQLLTGFSMGSEVEQQGVAQAAMWPGGIAVLTGSNSLWVVSSLDDPRPQRLHNPKLTSSPHCMAVLEPQHTLSGGPEVLLGVDDSVLVIDADSSHDAALGLRSALTGMAIAPNGQFVAGITADGLLVVWVADFTKVLSEYQTGRSEAPLQLAWCGTDSVVLAWEDSLAMVGPYGDVLHVPLPPPCVLVQELDGVRIITQASHQLLRRVPDPLADVFSPGSTHPGALLYDARKLFDSHNASADEVLRGIAADLPTAVSTCCDAALHALQPLHQAALMKAACYGRAFCPPGSFPKRRLASSAARLRVLNALRPPGVALPLTAAQLEAIGLPGVVMRLAAARQHLLAVRVAEENGLPADGVLEDWACARVGASGDVRDPELRDALVEKLSRHPGVRYASIAAHADSLGRKGLAALLLEHEPCAGQQVPLLLSLGEYECALGKACDSGDPDLVYLALFQLYRALPVQDFLQLAGSRQYARDLFLSYCRHQEPDLLEQLYLTMGMGEKAAELKVVSALKKQLAAGGLLCPLPSTDRPPAAPSDLQIVEFVRLLDRASELYAQTREHPFHAKAASELSKLRRLQAELEHETGQASFLGLSVADTIRQCIRLGNARAAARVKSEFKVGDKQYCWIRLRTLAAAKDWEALDAMSRDKRLPIGQEALVGAARAAGAPDLVLGRMIGRLADPKKQAEEYASAGMYKEAAEAAAAGRDTELLTRIQSAVGASSPIGLAVTQIKERLQASGGR